MESELRIFRSPDCLRPPKLSGEPHLLDHRCRPSPAQLLLDSSPSHGISRATHHRLCFRPHMEPLRTPPPLPHRRSSHRNHRHVLPPQRRQSRTLSLRRNHIRPLLPHAPRHLYQHGHAAIQNARRRHGQRETERSGLLHTELPLQRRLIRRLPRAHHSRTLRQQPGPRR